MRKYNQFAHAVSVLVDIDIPLDLYDEDKIPSMGNTIPMQQKSYFFSVHANLSTLVAFLEERLGGSDRETTEISYFLNATLRKTFHHEPKNEKEVQDHVETLLIGKELKKGTDYDREVGRVKIASKESIPDFIFPIKNIALEIKFSAKKEHPSKIIDEINADIAAYTKRYAKVIFLVYDLGIIRDEEEFRRDLEKDNRINLIVVKH